ncbi:hypothetical protein KQX54_014174 [Cotesia glomerata]|uniref:BEN domain-containing protein n=1 Tax=Cotesia glomerata TaxID=32391 RepID=A0AAV7IZ37_COTGL|nr:hypothetical protein KQX54_014174 [Cotesia glomerata]
MSDELLALVKWIGGKDDGQFTVGIPVMWIKDFDLNVFDPESEDSDTSYVVEWRVGKKKPWLYFDAQVIVISKNLEFLNRELRVLEGQISPYKPVQVSYSKKSKSSNDTSTESESKKKRLSSEKSSKNGKVNEILKRKCSKNHKSIEIDEEEIKETENNDDLEDSESERDEDGAEEVSPSDLLKKMYREIQTMKAAQADFIQNYAQNHRGNAEDNNTQQELGKAGSGVSISIESWNAAVQKHTYQSMGSSLIQVLFPTEVLLESNLRGNKSKIDKNAPRPALDQNKVTVEETLKSRFPDYKKSYFGSTINNMLNDLRKKNAHIAEENNEENNEDQ